MKTFEVEAPDGTVFEIQGDRMPTEAELNNIYSSFKETSGNEGQATSKLEEQFGTNPPPFNMFTKTLAQAGMAGPAADQPGAALPFVGQVSGNLIGAGAGPVGSAGGGVVGAVVGESARQMIGNLLGVQDSKKAMQQYVTAGKSAAESEIAGLLTGKLIEGFLSKAPDVANKLMNSVLKPSTKVLKKSPNLGVDAAREGLYGTKNSILNKAEDLITTQENRLQSILQGSDAQVNLGGLKVRLNSLADEMIDKTDKSAVREVLNDILESTGNKDVIPVSEANMIKRKIYNKLKDSVYGTTQIPSKSNAYKSAGNYFKTSIEGALPDEPIGELNRSIQVAGRVRNAMQDVIARSEKRNVVGLSDLMYGLLGAYGGHGGAGNMFMNAIGLPLAARALGSSSLKSGLAAGLGSQAFQDILAEGTKAVSPLVKGSIASSVRGKS